MSSPGTSFVRAAGALALVLALTLAGCGGEGGGLTGAEQQTDPIAGDPEPPDGADDIVGQEPLPPPELPEPTPTDLRRLCFTPQEDCIGRLLGYMQSERAGIDVAIYHLYDSRVSRLLLAKHQAGVPVRVIADRHAYTSQDKQAREMNFLAAGGVPVHTNRHRGIVHHKAALLHGLGLVMHGSLNFTAAGRKFSDEWADEVSFFTTSPRVFARFKERFDRMWNNTGDARQAFQLFVAGMRLPSFEESEQQPATTCYEDPRPSPRPLPDDEQLALCFVPDQHCNLDILVPIIKAETRRMDLLVFRATSFEITDPLVAKVRAGLPVRMIIERSQYRNPAYPNETTVINNLWAANTKGNLRMKATAHGGAMHMKAIITPDVATWGSGNLSRSSSKQVRGCQSKYYQDEDLVRTTDAGLVARMQARFDAMWDSPDFADFDPTTAGSSGVVDDVE